MTLDTDVFDAISLAVEEAQICPAGARVHSKCYCDKKPKLCPYSSREEALEKCGFVRMVYNLADGIIL